MSFRAVNFLAFVGLVACAAVSLFGGCATLGVRGEKVNAPGLQTATDDVWELYQCIGPAPTVLIVQGAALSCTDPNSGNPGFPVELPSGRACREGYTLSLDRVSVAYRGQPWSESALAHEELHACQARAGIFEPGHHQFTGPDWGPGGRLDRANVLLRTRGL